MSNCNALALCAMQNYFIIAILRLYVLIQNLVECKCLSTAKLRFKVYFIFKGQENYLL